MTRDELIEIVSRQVTRFINIPEDAARTLANEIAQHGPGFALAGPGNLWYAHGVWCTNARLAKKYTTLPDAQEAADFLRKHNYPGRVTIVPHPDGATPVVISAS